MMKKMENMIFKSDKKEMIYLNFQKLSYSKNNGKCQCQIL